MSKRSIDQLVDWSETSPAGLFPSSVEDRLRLMAALREAREALTYYADECDENGGSIASELLKKWGEHA